MPVSRTSPGCVKIILRVLEFCISSPPTQSFIARFCGFSMSEAGVIRGPSGQVPSKNLWPTQSCLNGETSEICGRLPQSRADRSLAMGYPATCSRAFSTLKFRAAVPITAAA